MNFKSVILSCAVLLMGFASCSKDDDNSPKEEGYPAFVRIQVKGTIPATSPRAIDNDQASEISDLTVFILGPSNEILNRKYMTATEYTNGASVKIPTTTIAQHIFVVGNVGSDQTGAGGLFGPNVLSYTQLQSAYLELSNLSTDYLWIEGHTTAPLSFVSTNPGDDLVATAAIQMELIPARIDVYVNNNMTNYDPAGVTSIKLADVGVLNTSGWSSPVPNFIPASTIPSLAPYYRSGFSGYPSFPATGVSVVPSLLTGWSANASSTFAPTTATPIQPANFIDQFTYTFYALPSLGRTVILSVRAALGTDGGGLGGSDAFLYFPVHFDTADTGFQTFENGKRYIMTINLNGNAAIGGGGGTDPEIPVTSAFVTVEVTPAQWDIKDLPSKDFN